MRRLTKLSIVLPFLALASCQKDFLDEEPLDFLSSENAFVTYADFNASVNNLYRLVRTEFYTQDENFPMDYIYGTDIVFDGQASLRRFTNYPGTMSPSFAVPADHWTDLYKIIAETNTILSRLSASKMTDSEKAVIEGRARFFRAFSYRTLAYLYGGVPLVLEEVTAPRYDYTRASKEEVLGQAIADLTVAVATLPGIAQVRDGEISKPAAQHLLAEVYLAAGDYAAAATAATAVIGDASVGLMRTRFGRRSTVTPGDVYWDLFQRGNQNRTAGNREGLWVVQFETDVPGGASTSLAIAGNALYERHHGPFLSEFRIGSSAPFLWPAGDYTGGRGIGWAVSTKHFSNTIWASDFTTDMRNANHNFVRVYTYNNPAVTSLFNRTVSTEAPPTGITVPSRRFYAYQSKVTTPADHPTNLYANPATLQLKATAGGTYTDQYMFRLAETYLIRAEAHFGRGDRVAAAADLNVVRSRAGASPVTPANVTLDYILDERMRELGIEEKRRLTLMRLGKVVDRVRRYNPYYSDIQDHHNLFPIPAAEIERNRAAVLEQNPGY
ncbi:RagB/SusD family nutrient uptake outer membrane protein (plasmid) [Hymenobacter tibetensis]|uniref:RagB/SusD family nutrient uptake outer membrane protein n=1 Tax=Hymenobacter tibetensis TaxID=497967 RepID=A0ABY4D803_9BACT|nr:RagB/SusD family nutrient uptake outer membrane protein [Hymenobacter tibetensis]UOG77324.1 RagB/SusD family nutrient uptake outer membrane protein [Hymenobacter tibetensis]